MIYITGDCHANYTRFSTDNFPEQKDMTEKDMMIVCGDFGLWHDTPFERFWFQWLSEKPFTILFVDGNHENFDRLYGDEFEVVDFHGGKAHRIRNNIYHLMRGYVFTLCGKKFFAFGGASSHDIKDGILDIKNYGSQKEMHKDYDRRFHKGEMIRINRETWWEQELPTKEEMDFGIRTLAENDNEVDYVITHCCPSEVLLEFSKGEYEPDTLTAYFDEISGMINFKRWYFGHYHNDMTILDKYTMLYQTIERIV